MCCPRIGFRKIPFDFLVVATGVRPSYFDHDEFARYAPSLKSLSDAETIRAKILSAFEAAELTDDKAERARQMTFVLVGAGPTGVELAASMAHMVAHTLQGNFRRILILRKVQSFLSRPVTAFCRPSPRACRKRRPGGCRSSVSTSKLGSRSTVSMARA